MVKPPKPIPLTTPSDALSTPPRPGSNQSAGPRSGTDTPDLAAGNTVRTPEPSADVAPDATGRLPSVVVNASPESIARLLESNMNSITWPAANAHMLRAIDNGLFHSPQGGTYAQVIGEGYLQVERQTNGRYRVFWPASLGSPARFCNRSTVSPSGGPTRLIERCSPRGRSCEGRRIRRRIAQSPHGRPGQLANRKYRGQPGRPPSRQTRSDLCRDGRRHALSGSPATRGALPAGFRPRTKLARRRR